MHIAAVKLHSTDSFIGKLVIVCGSARRAQHRKIAENLFHTVNLVLVRVPRVTATCFAADALEGVIANLLKTTAEPVSELKARTMEDGGDPNAISLDFIPRLHERLVAQYESHRRKQDHGAQCGATAQRNSLLGFVPESRRKFNGRTCDDDRKSGERHHIKWRLCHPRTIHYTQRGTHGSEFSCGYRNIQILCSALMEWPEYRR